MAKKTAKAEPEVPALPTFGFSALFEEQRTELIRQDSSLESKINNTIKQIAQTPRGAPLPSSLRPRKYEIDGVSVIKVYVDDELRLSFHWENREIVFRKVGHHNQMEKQP